jgi:hypothetical protein
MVSARRHECDMIIYYETKKMDMNKYCRRASSREGKDGMLAIRGRKGECSGREFYDPPLSCPVFTPSPTANVVPSPNRLYMSTPITPLTTKSKSSTSFVIGTPQQSIAFHPRGPLGGRREEELWLRPLWINRREEKEREGGGGRGCLYQASL